MTHGDRLGRLATRVEQALEAFRARHGVTTRVVHVALSRRDLGSLRAVTRHYQRTVVLRPYPRRLCPRCGEVRAWTRVPPVHAWPHHCQARLPLSEGSGV